MNHTVTDQLLSFVAFLSDGTELSIAAFVGLCSAAFAGSLVSASIGLGGGVLMIAVMAWVLPPTVLVPLHGIVQASSNGFRALLLRRHVRHHALLPFIIGTIIGACLGGSIAFSLQAWLLQLILAMFVLYATWVPDFRSNRPGMWKFFGCGTGSGFVTMFVGGTGPLVAPFVNAAYDKRQEVVATHATLMTFQHCFKIGFFSLMGFSAAAYIPLLIGLLVSGMIGTWVGRTLLDRLNEQLFRRLFRLVLTLLAARMLYAALIDITT